jgi:3-oxoacyl-[acyl-carrier protein] reductase
MIDLKDKVALVTGGSRGIGAAIAKALADAGARVAITYSSNLRSARQVAKEIAITGRDSLILRMSVGDEKDVRKGIKTIISHFGKIDILVNNAGIWKRGPLESMSEKEWDETLTINLKGPFLLCREVTPIMKKQRGGKIINIASTAGQRGEAFYSHYAASKGGIIAFTKSIAVELALFGIHVNGVAPGWVTTDMTVHVLRDRRKRKQIAETIPRGKVATPEDIAGAVLFLASHLSDHLIGAVLSVNGGSVLSD